MIKNKDLSVYVHIPFCKSRCHYCDFTSCVYHDDTQIKTYVDHIIKEIELLDAKGLFLNHDIKTMYFGGGTPSLLKTAYFRSILERISLKQPKFNGELTVEANPTSITDSFISELKMMGVNRISIGVQSLNDETLKKIGRMHNKVLALKSVSLVNTYNLNISVDLMIGIPDQDEKDILEFINEFSKFENVNHISTYMLSIEPGTKLEKLVNDKIVTVPDDDRKIELFNYAEKILEQKGFKRYEISNFAKIGFESKHNSKYWNMDDYIGLGLSAHSLIGNNRFYNPSDFDTYYSSLDKGKLAYIEEETLSDLDMESEYIMLRFRMSEGINLKEFYNKFNKEFLKAYSSQIEKNKQYLNINKNNISIKDEYLNVMNSIVVDFI